MHRQTAVHRCNRTSNARIAGTLPGVVPASAWELVAAHPVLDFVNTVDERLTAQPVELLRDADDLADWALAVGLLTSRPRRRPGAAHELEVARRLRTHLISILDAVADGRLPEPADLRALAAEAAAGYEVASLAYAHDRLGWAWSGQELESVRHRLAVLAVDLLAGEELARLGRCPGAGCGWFFLDTTKRGNRRWCSMRTCGQEAKTARRRTRSH